MATVSSTAASLRVAGDDLNPDKVTRLLGKAPTLAYRRGDTLQIKYSRGVIARTGMWSVEAEPCEPGDLDAQLAAILEGMTTDLSVWADLTRRFKADLFCGLFVNNGNEGICLSPASLRDLGLRGISLGLDIYASTPDDVI